MDAGQIARRPPIDPGQAGMGDRAAQYFGVQHAGQIHIDRIARRAGNFFPRILAGGLCAGDAEIGHVRHWPSPVAAAISTASMIIL